MCAWPNPMTTEPVSARTEFTLHNDLRLLAAVDAVIAYSGQRSGLSAAAQAALSTAVRDAGRQALSAAGGQASKPDAAPSVTIVVEDFPDRVEVSLEPGLPATPPAARPDSPRPGVDAVTVESHHGASRLRLIQYAVGHAPKAK
jgi:hypothetical protein